MPRQRRIFYPGVAAHVVHRAADGRACFQQDSNYLLYLAHLRELSRKHGARVHAYCLMTNHVHLLVSPSTTDGCKVMMKELGHRYSQYFNRSYGRTGPLWGGRYYSCIAESAQYVLACYRYIELNPVRAGMVAHPADYRWSSYSANAEGALDQITSPHEEFLALGSQEQARRLSYKNLFCDALGESLLVRIRQSTLGGYPLASEAFKANLDPDARLAPGRSGRRPKAPRKLVPDTDC